MNKRVFKKHMSQLWDATELIEWVDGVGFRTTKCAKPMSGKMMKYLVAHTNITFAKGWLHGRYPKFNDGRMYILVICDDGYISATTIRV